MKRHLSLALVALLAVAPATMADSLSVTPEAAINGNFGLEVFHDNTSTALVQDNSPNSETVYRAEFTFNPNNISPQNGNWRQTIFRAISPNPRPGVQACHPTQLFTSAFRIFLFLANGGIQYNVQAWIRGNSCGEVNVGRIQISPNIPTKICLEWQTGANGTGRAAIAAVSPHTDSCPPSGDPAYNVRTGFSNHLQSIEHVMLGTSQTNGFNRGESGDIYFDDFASYRTLAP